jgi:hypothetical protein
VFTFGSARRDVPRLPFPGYRSVVNKDHWALHARQWELLGSPLGPSLEDGAAVRAAVAAWRAEHPGGRLRALVKEQTRGRQVSWEHSAT